MHYCLYYQAHVKAADTWFFVATLRAHDHVAFDRTLDKTTGLFEIFVPQEREQEFLNIMQYYVDNGIISNFQQLPNRLLDAQEVV